MVDNIYMSRREEDGRNSERRSGNRGEREAGALQIELSFFLTERGRQITTMMIGKEVIVMVMVMVSRLR